jgi:hypothetical protein
MSRLAGCALTPPLAAEGIAIGIHTNILLELVVPAALGPYSSWWCLPRSAARASGARPSVSA